MADFKLEDLVKPMPSPRVLFDMLYGASKLQILEAAVLTGVFDHMDRCISAGDVAGVIDAHEKNTEVFLDALSAMGLINKSNGRYRNTTMSSAFLRRGLHTYLGDYILAQSRIHSVSPERIRDMVLYGPPAPILPEEDSGEFWGDFSKQYANYMRAGTTAFQMDLIKGIPELGIPTRILELGGGPGVTAVALAGQFADATVTVIEQPPVAEAVNSMAELYGVHERVHALGGSYITDDLGEDYDLIFASFTLNYARNCLVDMMGKIRDALTPGGIFVSVADGLTCERTHPADYVVSMLPWALAGQVEEFDMGEVKAAMTDAGIEILHSFELESPHGPAVIDVGRRQEFGNE